MSSEADEKPIIFKTRFCPSQVFFLCICIARVADIIYAS